LTASFAAMLQISFRRARAAWPIVGAAGLVCLLATTLLAAAPMYAGAVSLAGLQRVLADAPPDDANVAVSLRVDSATRDAVDQVVRAEVARALGSVAGAIAAIGRSDTFGLPDRPQGPRTELVELGYAEGLADHASLTAGAWPTDQVEGPVPVAVAGFVAGPLGLAIGDELLLPSRAQTDVAVPVRIAAIFRIDDPNDPFWWDEPQVLDGLVTSDRFATWGPLFTTIGNLASHAPTGRFHAGWRAQTDVGSLTVSGIAELRRDVGGLGDRLRASLGGLTVTVTTALPEILARSERSLLVSRTGVLVLTVQFVILAAYAVLLSAALLVEHRRMDSAMLRSRGAGPARVAGLALVEGLLLTIPAAVAGPWLAAIALRGLNVAGPLADIDLRIEPVITPEAYAAAAAAAAACLVALLLPALPRIRSFASIHSDVGRAETRTVGQRFGIDVALLAIAGLGLWQLRHYGAPLTESVQGTLGIDPLLVATPAIGFLAGAVLALRVVPMVAHAIEGGTSRGRGLVASLGARQLARRPLRYTRAALLLMLAMAMGVFSITYTQTWAGSQRDQATFQVGTDVRVRPGRRTSSPPRWSLARAYDALRSVRARSPIHREPVAVPGISGGVTLVGLDAARAEDVVRMRADLSAMPLSALMEPLAAARPPVEGVPLSGEPRRLRFGVRLAVEEILAPVADPETGETGMRPVEPGSIHGQGTLGLAVVVRDAVGHPHRFEGEVGALTMGPQRLAVALGDPDAVAGATFAYPLDLIGVEVTVRLPAGAEATVARLIVDELELNDEVGGEDPELGHGWRPASTTSPDGWRIIASTYGLPYGEVGSGPREDLTAETRVAGLTSIPGIDQFGRGTVLVFGTAGLSTVGADPLPAVATTALLEATGRAIGDDLPLGISGVRSMIRLVGAVEAFPTVDPGEPAALVDFETLALLRFAGSNAVDPAEEWWFAADEGAQAALVARLRDPAIGSEEVVSRVERGDALASDPVALGIVGILAVGVVAAGLFAVVGFIVSAAVAARERVTEFALLRALGLSSGQLSGWLSLENATLAVVSLVAGSGLGLLIGWVALPFVTVTQGAERPFPPVEVAVPWPTIAMLEVVAITSLATAVALLGWLLRRVGMASALRMGED
jgi:hypothetical protein